MSQAAIHHVMELIEQLPEEDRLELEKLLAQKFDTEWKAALTENRRISQQRGITEETIDRAIHRRRYGVTA